MFASKPRTPTSYYHVLRRRGSGLSAVPSPQMYRSSHSVRVSEGRRQALPGFRRGEQILKTRANVCMVRTRWHQTHIAKIKVLLL